MNIEKGTFFTANWFIGEVEVIEVVPKLNELKVKLTSNTTSDRWIETWSLAHLINGFNNGDYLSKIK